MANGSTHWSRPNARVQRLLSESDAFVIVYFPYRSLQQIWHLLSSLHSRSGKSLLFFFNKSLFFSIDWILKVILIYYLSQFLTPSKLYLEYSYSTHQKPFYHQTWFLVTLAAGSVVIITLLVAVLCVKSKSYKYKRNFYNPRHAYCGNVYNRFFHLIYYFKKFF